MIEKIGNCFSIRIRTNKVLDSLKNSDQKSHATVPLKEAWKCINFAMEIVPIYRLKFSLVLMETSSWKLIIAYKGLFPIKIEIFKKWKVSYVRSRGLLST